MRNKQRPSWDSYFMLFAKLAASRSNCLMRRVGAVIVKDKRILATGYNGSPPGAPQCIDEGRCFRRTLLLPHEARLSSCRANHAEQNAIHFAARYGISIEGATMYSTIIPCPVCAKAVASSGIKEVVYERVQRRVIETTNDKIINKLPYQFLEEGGVTIRKIEPIQIDTEWLAEVFGSESSAHV